MAKSKVKLEKPKGSEKVPTLLRIPRWLNDWLESLTGEGKAETRQDVILEILRGKFNEQQQA